MSDNEICISELPDGLVVTGVRLDEKDFVASEGAGEWGMGTYTGGRPAPTYDEIAQLAYCFYELRGHQDGHDMEDWLRAEQQLVRHYA